MTKPAVVIPSPPNAPGILRVDTDTGIFGPTPTYDVGHEQGRCAGVDRSESSSGAGATLNTPGDTVRQLAFALWEARGRPHGSSEVDWLAAEREVTGRHTHTSDREGGVTVNSGLGLMKSSEEKCLTDPGDGHGPLRVSDDQGYDAVPDSSTDKTQNS